jgi:DNA polymerase-3 subunit delta'
LLVDRDGVEPGLAERSARAAQGHIGLALRYATEEGALQAREESARTVLSLRGAGEAVKAAAGLVDGAGAEAKSHGEKVTARAKEDFLRSAGIDDGKVPPALRSQMRQLEEDAKRRQTRLVRDVLDRYLLDVHSVLRDVLTVQLGSGSALINPGVEDEVRSAAEDTSPQITLQLLESVGTARERIAGNVPPLLALEALLTRIALRAA